MGLGQNEVERRIWCLADLVQSTFDTAKFKEEMMEEPALQTQSWKLLLLVRVAAHPHHGILAMVLLFYNHTRLSLIQPDVPHGSIPKAIIVSEKDIASQTFS